MNRVFFDELGIPEPEYNLEVGSGFHGWQTGEMIRRAEDVLIKEKPDSVLVFGDTNSTLAGSIAARKLNILLAHIEAGLRSYNRKMPEEINRVLTDHCSEILFCPSENAIKNLKKEGFLNIAENGKLTNICSAESTITNNSFPIVINVGDIMYDALLLSMEIAERKSTILERLRLEPKGFYLATIHRAENTDDRNRLKNIIEALVEISKLKPVIFPIHPRTRQNFQALNVLLRTAKQFHLIEPVNYYSMLVLQKNADKILTDSGGIQKEAYLLEVPCLTLRDETEWVETVKCGWNVLVGADKARIIETTKNSTRSPDKNLPDHYGDGRTAERVLIILGML
jgi:UDP-N-acetylglucosamine 2-epimerase